MTIEEAGEIILEGRKYIDCPRTGTIRNHIDCELCKGWRNVPSLEYAEACLVLGMRAPLPMDSEAGLKLDWYIKSRAEFYGDDD